MPKSQGYKFQFLYDICDISIAASVFIFFKMCMG